MWGRALEAFLSYPEMELSCEQQMMAQAMPLGASIGTHRAAEFQLNQQSARD